MEQQVGGAYQLVNARTQSVYGRSFPLARGLGLVEFCNQVGVRVRTDSVVFQCANNRAAVKLRLASRLRTLVRKTGVAPEQER